MVANTQIHSIVIIQKVFHNPHKGHMPRIPVYSISHPALTFRLPGVFKDFAAKCTIDQGIETGLEQCSLSGDKMMNPKRHQIKFHFWGIAKSHAHFESFRRSTLLGNFMCWIYISGIWL
jgi:hypothetical protein